LACPVNDPDIVIFQENIPALVFGESMAGFQTHTAHFTQNYSNSSRVIPQLAIINTTALFARQCTPPDRPTLTISSTIYPYCLTNGHTDFPNSFKREDEVTSFDQAGHILLYG